MKIIGVNGSHRSGKGTSHLLAAVLDEASAAGAQVELVELADLDIQYCVGCNACLAKPACALSGDDMAALVEKLLAADGIVLASPDYFSSVSARMKTFMERTRPQHMVANAFKGKVGGMVATAGLSDCGVEETLAAMDRWFATQEMLVVHPRPEGPVLGSGAAATQYAGFNAEKGRVQWRRVEDDQVAFNVARQLGCDMVELLERLGA